MKTRFVKLAISGLAGMAALSASAAQPVLSISREIEIYGLTQCGSGYDHVLSYAPRTDSPLRIRFMSARDQDREIIGDGVIGHAENLLPGYRLAFPGAGEVRIETPSGETLHLGKIVREEAHCYSGGPVQPTATYTVVLSPDVSIAARVNFEKSCTWNSDYERTYFRRAKHDVTGTLSLGHLSVPFSLENDLIVSSRYFSLAACVASYLSPSRNSFEFTLE
jgi:hypothetical protein